MEILQRKEELILENRELHLRLKRAKEKNLPYSIILSIENKIARNVESLEVLDLKIAREIVKEAKRRQRAVLYGKFS